MKVRKLFFGLLMLVLITSIASASDLDIAKEQVEKYYQYSQEKDVEKYVSLFHPDWLVNLYGEGYKEYIRAGFELTEIKRYSVDYQYYTEGESSLSLFYNLEAKAVVDGESMTMDQDLVAIFDKTNKGLLIRYVMLQNVYVAQLNQETIMVSAAHSVIDEQGTDLIAEAQKEGVFDINKFYEFSERGQKQGSGFFGTAFKLLIWVAIIVGLFWLIMKYLGSQKEKGGKRKVSKLTNKFDHKKHLETIKGHTKKASKAAQVHAKAASKKMRPHAKKAGKGLLKFLQFAWKKLVEFGKWLGPALVKVWKFLRENVHFETGKKGRRNARRHDTSLGQEWAHDSSDDD